MSIEKKTDLRAVEDASSVSGHRLVLVLEEIALRGPVSLSQLEETLDIPRVSIWRAARSLRERGWVRLQYGGKYLELTPFVNRLFSEAHIAVPECEEYAPVFDMVLQSRLFHVSVGLLHGAGRFEMVETSQRSELNRGPLSLVYDIAPLAAQLACDRVEVHRHLVNFLPRATPEEQRVIRSGEHLRHLEDLSTQKVVWGEERVGFAVPWRFKTGSCGAVEIQLRVHTRKAKQELAELAERVTETGIPQRGTSDLLNPPIRKQILR